MVTSQHAKGAPTVACTIAARNFLPRVRVLANSFRRHHPDGTFTAFIVDDPVGRVGRGEPFEVLRATQLGLSPGELRAMTLYYDVTELSTALKPWVLECLLADKRRSVLYLDPDCEVFAPLDSLTAAASEQTIVLTPHLTEPMPRDGLLPDERHILSSGIYNLGFIGLGELSKARSFLEFWKTRLRYDAIIDHDRMLFTDQRWIDFVPGMFDHHIERDPGCNVAYWNAHERRLSVEDGTIRAAGRPLRFFHFSGFDPKKPDILSKHSGDRPRLALDQQPVLNLLCRRYSEHVHAQDFDGASALPYWWDVMPNGVHLSPPTRRVLRDLYVDADATGEGMPPALTDKGGVSALMEWLLGKSDGGTLRFPTAVRWLAASRPSGVDRRLADRAAVALARSPLEGAR